MLHKDECALRRRRYHMPSVPSCFSVKTFKSVVNGAKGSRKSMLERGGQQLGLDQTRWNVDQRALTEFAPYWDPSKDVIQNALNFFRNMSLDKVRRMKVGGELNDDSVGKVVWADVRNRFVAVYVRRKRTVYYASTGGASERAVACPTGCRIVRVNFTNTGTTAMVKCERLVRALLQTVWGVRQHHRYHRQPSLRAALQDEFANTQRRLQQRQQRQHVQEKRNKAAKKIQRTYRDHRTKIQKNRNKAAKKIQRTYRDHRTKKLKHQADVEEFRTRMIQKKRNRTVKKIQQTYRDHRAKMWSRYFKPVNTPPTGDACKLRYFYESMNLSKKLGGGEYGTIKLYIPPNNKNAYKMRNNFALRMPHMVIKKFTYKGREGEADSKKEFQDHRELWNLLVESHKDDPTYYNSVWVTKPVYYGKCGSFSYMASEYISGVNTVKPVLIRDHLEKLAKDYDTKKITKETFEDKLRLLRNALIDILTELNTYGYSHTDLHDGNMLYDNAPGRKVPIRLIDIGLIDNKKVVECYSKGKSCIFPEVGDNTSEWLRIVLKYGFSQAIVRYPIYRPFWALVKTALGFRPLTLLNNREAELVKRFVAPYKPQTPGVNWGF